MEQLSAHERISENGKRLVFLTLTGLFDYAWRHHNEEWGNRAVFFLDADRDSSLDPTLAGDDPAWQSIQAKIAKVVEAAEEDGRVAWRNDNPVDNQRTLNEMLLKSGSYEGMNPNLPPADDVDFLRRALCTAPGIIDRDIIS